MKKLSVLQFGTFDVYNYGDLLFPLIAKMHLSKNFDLDLKAISPLGQKLNFSDAFISQAFNQQINQNQQQSQKIDAVIIGGGNIIHNKPRTVSDYKADDLSFLAYSDLWLGPSYVYPQDVPIIWNAPGVPNKFHKIESSFIKNALQRVNYISVRDKSSADNLLEIYPDVNVSIVPDSAWFVNQLWSKEFLKSEYQKILLSNSIDPDQKTLAVHLNTRYLGKLSLNEIAAKLDRFAAELNSKVILIPIGACHNDDQIALEVFGLMKSKAILLAPKSLCEIAACIANSQYYIGSSMHGLITASAYQVPGICVSNRKNHKFLHLEELCACGKLVAGDWDEAFSEIKNIDYAKRQADLAIAINKTHHLLELHWKKISEIISSSNPKALVADQLKSAFANYQYLTLINQSKCQELEKSEIKDALTKEKLLLVQELKQQISKLSESKRLLEFNLATKTKELELIHNSIILKVIMPFHILLRLIKGDLKLKNVFVKIKYKIKTSRPYLFLRNIKLLHEFYLRLKRKLVSARQLKIKLTDQELQLKVEKYLEENRKLKIKKTVVYTAIINNYDILKVPLDLNPEWDYVCFTDRKEYQGVHPWKIRHVDFFAGDATRTARFVKLRPDIFLAEYESSIWIDANILIKGDFLNSAFAKFEKSQEVLAGIIHPLRNCVYQEFKACQELNKDESVVLDEQLEFYKEQGLPQKLGLIETNLLFRKHNFEQLIEFQKIWWQILNRYSKRDQLSIMYALWRSGLVWTEIMSQGYSLRNHPDFFIFSHGKKFSSAEPQYKVPAFLPENYYLDQQACWANQSLEFDLSVLGKFSDQKIDIVICVHNAYEDVKNCITSVLENLCENHRIIIVDDGSESPTKELLQDFKNKSKAITLIRHDSAFGYTFSANAGLEASQAEFLILLNSDTIVSKNWALKLLQVAQSREQIGIVGPLSNAASWQSVPIIKDPQTGQFAVNQLEHGYNLEQINNLCEKFGCLESFPLVPLVNGFCMGIKRKLINQIGLFDIKNFPLGYGEEDDFSQRAIDAGFMHSIATHCYVYHAKSKSFGNEKRSELSRQGAAKLKAKHGEMRIKRAVEATYANPVLQNIRRKLCQQFNLRFVENFVEKLNPAPGVLETDLQMASVKKRRVLNIVDAQPQKKSSTYRVDFLLPKSSKVLKFEQIIDRITKSSAMQSFDLQVTLDLAQIFGMSSSKAIILHSDFVLTRTESKELVSFCKSRGIFLAYYLADLKYFENSLKLPEKLNTDQTNELDPTVKYLLKYADYVLVANPELLVSIAQLNSNIMVLPEEVEAQVLIVSDLIQSLSSNSRSSIMAL